MRVINTTEDNGKLIECNCGAELEYVPSDMHVGQFGSMFLACPVCGDEILLEDEDPVILTTQNLEWPKHFSLPDGTAADIPDHEIQKWLNTCLRHADSEMYPDGSFISMGSGNTMVFVLKYGDEYSVYVTKNYAITSIPREENVK